MLTISHMTSSGWYAADPRQEIITDFRGWDPNNFQASWQELITHQEYCRRYLLSGRIPMQAGKPKSDPITFKPLFPPEPHPEFD